MNEAFFVEKITEIKQLLAEQIKISNKQLEAINNNNMLLENLISALDDEGVIEEEEVEVSFLNPR